MSAVDLGAKPRRATDVAVVVIGVVIGTIVGAVATAVAIGWALFQTAQSGSGQAVPLLITTQVTGGQITASSGDGLVVPTLVLALLGGLIAVAIRFARRSR